MSHELDGDATLGDLQAPHKIMQVERVIAGLPLVIEVDSCSRCLFASVEATDDGRHVEVSCGHDAVAVPRERQVAVLPLLGEAAGVSPPAWCPLRDRAALVRIVPGV